MDLQPISTTETFITMFLRSDVTDHSTFEVGFLPVAIVCGHQLFVATRNTKGCRSDSDSRGAEGFWVRGQSYNCWRKLRLFQKSCTQNRNRCPYFTFSLVDLTFRVSRNCKQIFPISFSLGLPTFQACEMLSLKTLESDIEKGLILDFSLHLLDTFTSGIHLAKFSLHLPFDAPLFYTSKIKIRTSGVILCRPQKLPAVANMATIGDVATVVSLIGKVIKAATDAQMLKKEFKELVDYLELVGRQLEMLDDGELDDAAMEAFQKMGEVLFQCHDLADSCQRRRTIYLVFNGKKIQNQIRGAQEKITKYLTLIPLIHFTQVFRQFKVYAHLFACAWFEFLIFVLDKRNQFKLIS
ncbi:hypothetical protein ZIOFF_047918 [Zingiber officinale]|uniref:MCAfunc domain-containing protein n=1 Tax=Zingiber officinale TaxID=94328 RepID=A0A8J5KRK8_ZINOF|nr:hypothetical protein ZIOFF_047918 [Zingiber officinale]